MVSLDKDVHGHSDSEAGLEVGVRGELTCGGSAKGSGNGIILRDHELMALPVNCNATSVVYANVLRLLPPLLRLGFINPFDSENNFKGEHDEVSEVQESHRTLADARRRLLC